MTSPQTTGGPGDPTRLADLLELERMRRLVLLYGRGFDRSDWGLVRSCFTPDAMIEGLRGPRPVDEVLEHSASLAAQYVANMHLVIGQIAHRDGDHGHVDSYLIAYHWMGDPAGSSHANNLVAGACYHDDMVRSGGRWLIRRRFLQHLWHDGVLPSSVGRLT